MNPKARMLVTCLVAALAWAPARSDQTEGAPGGSSEADILELDSGRLLQGSVQAVTATEILVEVDQRTLTLPRDEVSSIRFGVAPADVHAALEALKALAPPDGGDTSLEDYDLAVGEARTLYLSFNHALGEAQRLVAIDEALHLAWLAHLHAAATWAAAEQRRTGGDRSIEAAIAASDPLLVACPELERFLAKEWEWESRDHYSRDTKTYRHTYRQTELRPSLEAFWRCAASQIAEAERLIDSRPR